jgi:hypothetical protein
MENLVYNDDSSVDKAIFWIRYLAVDQRFSNLVGRF